MSDWIEVRLGDICEFISRGITPNYSDDGILVLNQKCIRDNRVNSALGRYTAIDTKINPSKLLKNGDILINSTGTGTLGRVSIFKGASDCVTVDGHVTILRAQKSVSPVYLGYFLHSIEPLIENLGRGSTNQKELSTGDLKRIRIVLPDITTQNKVAEQLSVFDSMIDNNSGRIELLERAAQELYKEWFVRFRFPGYENTKFENGLPEGWKIKRMNEFCYVTDGTHDTPKPVDVGVPLVTGRCISSGFVDFDAAYNISEADHEGIKKRSGLKSGDILFSIIGTVGNCCIVDYDREFSVKNVIIFKPETMRDTAYLYYWMTSSTMQEIFGAQTNGASQLFVGLTFMRRYKLLVPKDDILEAFADKVLPIMEQKRLLHQKNLNLAVQRDMLLPRLMSGKLEV